MEPIITLPYSEWLVAEQLMKAFPVRDGYSIYAPLSRQEKGVDLILARRVAEVSRVVTLQVKYSRSFEQPPSRKFRFETLFRAFPVGKLADFFVLAALYPNITGRGNGKKDSWRPLLLLFDRPEMAKLIDSLRTRSGGVDRMFGFGFDDPPTRVLHTRGVVEPADITQFTFENRVGALKSRLDEVQQGAPADALASRAGD